MTLLKDNNYKDINVALLSLEADIKNKITGFDTSEIDKQLAEINSRIDKINAGGGNNSSDEIEDINSKLNINSIKIKNIEQNIEDIDTQINDIEQKLSDIFSAENKVTDLNTTTTSGIYYWAADAANRPSDYGVLLVNKHDGGSTTSLWVNQIAYGTNNKIYFRQNINSGSWTEWKAVAFDGELTAKKVANALTVNGKTYDGSSAVDAGVQTVANGGTGATDAASGFNTLADGVRDSSTPEDDEKMLLKPAGTWYKTTCLDFWNYIKGKISSVLGLTKDTYGGKAASAGTADYARNMYYKSLDLSALDKTKFYPLVCYSGNDFAEVAIWSEMGLDSMDYNQNRIHFDISTQGWSDLRPTLNIREYTCYQNNEITIGCIGRGTHNGAWAIWLRGGLHYTCFSRNGNLNLQTSNYTFYDETYTVGTNYYGGSNTNVVVMFTPQSTITEGAYSTRPITASRIKANNKMVIPIGAPSSLEDGCIWIER